MLKYQSLEVPQCLICSCAQIGKDWYIKPPVAKDSRKNYSMHSENFQADFLKMASATYATFKNTSHHLFFLIFFCRNVI